MLTMKGYFSHYGGQFVPETLMTSLRELERGYVRFKKDKAAQKELQELLKNFVGRPTPLYFAKNLTKHYGGAKIYLKREDLAHTGAHKINHAVGQALLAKFMGKTRIIAETGAGQHGVATAAAAALLGIPCRVYMGSVDMERQKPNVLRMRLLGAEVTEVSSGSKTLKDAINEAIRDWVGNVRTTYYLLGSVLGPHPYPSLVRDFQKIVGKEAKRQILKAERRLPDELIACVGGGSNSLGLFSAFMKDRDVAMTGVEAGGEGIASGKHAARFEGGRIGILHGTISYVLQNTDGQIQNTHSVSAGLDYPSIGPEHAALHDEGRISYTYATDKEALEAFKLLSRLEGIIPALESAHAVAEAIKAAKRLGKGKVIVVNLSGRGDKDLDAVSNYHE